MKVLSVVAITATIFLTGCYKFNHNYIMKGKWYVNSFEVSGGSTNLMEGVLPDYVDGDGQYMVYMLDNGLLRGEYYANDSLVYFRTGYWNMPHKDSVTFDIDKFIQGTFLIEQVDSKAFLLTTDDNYIEFFNIGSVPTVMRISRGEYIDPALTKP
jgi:hypothetical protein